MDNTTCLGDELKKNIDYVNTLSIKEKYDALFSRVHDEKYLCEQQAKKDELNRKLFYTLKEYKVTGNNLEDRIEKISENRYYKIDMSAKFSEEIMYLKNNDSDNVDQKCMNYFHKLYDINYNENKKYVNARLKGFESSVFEAGVLKEAAFFKDNGTIYIKMNNDGIYHLGDSIKYVSKIVDTEVLNIDINKHNANNLLFQEKIPEIIKNYTTLFINKKC